MEKEKIIKEAKKPPKGLGFLRPPVLAACGGPSLAQGTLPIASSCEEQAGVFSPSTWNYQ